MKIDDDHHILRGVSPSNIDDGGYVNPDVFSLRDNEEGCSFNWLEFFYGNERSYSEMLDLLRDMICSKREVRKSHRLAQLLVGDTIRCGAAFGLRIDVKLDPVTTTNKAGDIILDDSHVLLVGYSNSNEEFKAELADLCGNSLIATRT